MHLASFHDSIPYSTLSSPVVPPTIVTSPVSLQPVEGSRVALDCVANSDPPPTISWQRNNTPLTPPGRCAYHHYNLSFTLTLPSLSPSSPTLPSPSPHPPFSYFTLYPNGSLGLNLVNQSLEGVYMCTANNPGGVATLSHDVDVKGALSVMPTTHL